MQSRIKVNRNEPTEGRFSKPVEEALRKAGWFPGRTVPESELSQWYSVRWYAGTIPCYVFPKAVEILREFGGLSIKCSYAVEGYRIEPIHFDPRLCEDFREAIWFYAQYQINSMLFPLGIFREQDDDYKDVLLLDQKGRIWFAQYGVQLIAYSIEEAMERILRGMSGIEGYPDADHKLVMESKEIYRFIIGEREN